MKCSTCGLDANANLCPDPIHDIADPIRDLGDRCAYLESALESMTTERNRGLEFGWNRGVADALKALPRDNPFVPDEVKA